MAYHQPALRDKAQRGPAYTIRFTTPHSIVVAPALALTTQGAGGDSVQKAASGDSVTHTAGEA